MNYLKSQIFFSANTSDDVAEPLSRSSGIPLINDFGKYLGVPLIHHKKSRATYKELMDIFNKQLAGWKALCLPMARRITLAKSVLIYSKLAYQMQTYDDSTSLGNKQAR